MAICAAVTKKRRPCSIDADRVRDGVWLCHVHDPQGLFRQNVVGKREREAPMRRVKQLKRKSAKRASWLRRRAGPLHPRHDSNVWGADAVKF